MPFEMQYSEHAKIAYTSVWKTVAWEPKTYDSLTFKMSENTPTPALPPQRDPSLKKTSSSGATNSTHSVDVDQSSLVGKSTENFLSNILRVTNFSLYKL
jgi:hypothetical protein